MWQAGTPTEVDSNETNQAVAGDVITWPTKNMSPLSMSAYDHQTWQDHNLLWCAPVLKVTSPFDHVVL